MIRAAALATSTRLIRTSLRHTGRRHGSANSSFAAVHASLREYSSTSGLLKKNKNDDDEEMAKLLEDSSQQGIQKLNTDMSDEEVEKLLDEELAKIEAEKRAKEYPDWKPGERKRPLVMSYRLEDFEAELNPDQSMRRWSTRDKRCGALAIKVGMMPVWDDWGERHPCTVLYLDSNVVVGHKTTEKNGYIAAQIAGGERKSKNVRPCVLGQYSHLPDTKEQPPYLVREFRVTDEDLLPPLGSRIHARHFTPGQNVDVAGISKGKGFQGAMKRHNFAGMPATHGTSLSHRALGSTGQCQDPGKVFKGKKMAGRMGTDRVTVQNIRVIKVDRGRNLLYVKGAIPGNKGAFVEIRDAVKKPLWGTDKVLDKLDLPPLPTFEYDEQVDGAGEKHEESMPLPQHDPFIPDEDAVAA